MEFRTIVQLPARRLQLTPTSRVVLIGSCFAEHIGRRMAGSLPAGHVAVNPNGVLYNPGSIFTAIRLLLGHTEDCRHDPLFEGPDGLWRHWLYAGEFAAATREACLEGILQRRKEAQNVLNQAEALFITLSTDQGYFLSPDCSRSLLVANCHKQPQQRFTSATLPFDALLDEGNALLNELAEQFPALQIIFTVSPYRYRKYGLHESQLSKARLLHAIDLWCAEHSNAGYFPAYEIVVDELRDYRFYAPDMLHPSDQAVDYVWERFREWAFTPLLCQYADEQGALLRDFAHRPLHPESDSARRFAHQCEKRKAAFLHKWQQEPPV